MSQAKHMIFEDYRKSALKHIKTCEFMLNGLSQNGINEKIKDDILRNVFYLSGYIIECIVNYSIYKKLNYSNNDVQKLNVPLDHMYAVSLRYPTRKEQRLRKKYYIIGKHNYIQNLYILRHSKLSISPVSLGKLPIVWEKEDSKNITSVLFYNWRVTQRYQTKETHFCSNPNIVINENAVQDYLNLAKSIYTNLLLIV